eukprot:CAMPEP_0184497000 /NCGR_PEP_ID=MMETSP0113_2-20130426/35443_1 /TAXON_ID=91329 /ORGANISM="Norrisiella sphaerica, Strain BC52" /LENGTH=30 /DNA_ID= /DNA_START= /DNA_END= /DNA_ORIENTATION=
MGLLGEAVPQLPGNFKVPDRLEVLLVIKLD